MKKPDYLILTFSGIVLLGIGMLFQKVPGYMDAEYYYSAGIRLFEGFGFTEEIIWNYLSDPQALPAASHTYWMPLPSILAAGGMFLCGASNYYCARIPFLLIGVALSPLTALVSWRFFKNRSKALFSGFFALFSGFYLVYITAVETFGLYLFLGAIFLFLTEGIFQKSKAQKSKNNIYLFLGFVCSGFYLSRADGLIWLLAAVIVLLLDSFRQSGKIVVNKKAFILFLQNGFGLLLGFILVVFPWILRTYKLFGSLTTPGSHYMFFLTDYDQLFSFPPDSLTFTNWQASGWSGIFESVVNAIKNNLQTFLAVQGSIFLFPFLVLGLWKHRKEEIVWVMCFAWIMIFTVMSIVFPHAGFRGGFLHSGSALQTFFWVMIPSGFSSALKFVGGKRKWDIPQAERFFRLGLIILSFLFSVFLFYQKVVVKENGVPTWEKNSRHYFLIAEELDDLFPEENRTVMVNNPPGFYLSSGWPSIVIPYGNLENLFYAADKFDADILILEKNHVDGLDALYENPEISSKLRKAAQVEDTYIFEIIH